MIPVGFDWQQPDYEPVFLERIARLEKIRGHEHPRGLVAGLREHYKHHPADFIADWGMTSDPRNAERGLPVNVPFLLFPKQWEFIGWLHDRWKAREDGLVEKSRDMGVSWLCVGFAAWMWSFYPDSVVGFGSRKEEYVDKLGDPKSLFWKLRTFIDFLPPEFQPAGWDSKKHAPFMRAINPETAAAIVGEAGDNIGRGNRTSIYFKDESAFYERPDGIDAALSQTSNCKIDVSTPNGAGNPFYRKRHGGKLPVFVFDWRDDPRKDEDWYRDQCAKLEAHIVAQEIDRDYEASVLNAFIPGAAVDECQRRGPGDVQLVGGLRVGVDPARFGDDQFAVVVRRGRAVLAIETLDKCDTIQGAMFVRQIVDAYRERPEQIAVDEIGIGAGVKDLLASTDYYGPDIVVGINSSIRMDGKQSRDEAIDKRGALTKTLYYNVRAFAWGEMKQWIEDGASLPMDADLKSELCATRYYYRGGALALESKDDMRKRGVKSPNKADALAMTFAKPVAASVQMTAAAARYGAALAGRAPASRSGY